MEAVKAVISMSDYMHIRKMLISGCPYELNFEESMENKLKIMGRGNQQSFVQHSEQVANSINKEENNSPIFPLHKWVCHLGPNMRHTAQDMVCNEGW